MTMSDQEFRYDLAVDPIEEINEILTDPHSETYDDLNIWTVALKMIKGVDAGKTVDRVKWENTIDVIHVGVDKEGTLEIAKFFGNRGYILNDDSIKKVLAEADGK
jgi:hypothetical protein